MVDAQVAGKKNSERGKIYFSETVWSEDKIFWDFSRIIIYRTHGANIKEIWDVGWQVGLSWRGLTRETKSTTAGPRIPKTSEHELFQNRRGQNFSLASKANVYDDVEPKRRNRNVYDVIKPNGRNQFPQAEAPPSTIYNSLKFTWHD